MSAAAGHIKHLYEELNFTSMDIISIISDLINGNIDIYEKFDGINIMMTVKNGRVLYARNQTQLKNPIDKNILCAMFDKYPHIKEVFIEVVNTLELAMLEIDSNYIKQLLNDGLTFLNLEIINSRSKNIISYNQNGLYINNALNLKTNLFDMDLANKIYRDNENIFKKYNIFPPKKLSLKINSNTFDRIRTELQGVYTVLSLNRIQSYYDSLGWNKKRIPTKSSLKTYIVNIGSLLINVISPNNGISILDYLKPSLAKIQEDGDLLLKMTPHIDQLYNVFKSPIPSIEGFVFYYNGIPYKITGLFGAINQIHGCIKYKR